ncbi:hypothetical protein MMC30_007823 [Trapelia coarctata]|nr:hypothetical protein [Trapelia coarctata]
MRELNLKRIREIALIAKGITTAEAAAASERASQKSLQRKRSASFLTARSDSDGAPSSADDDDAASLASEATSSPDAAPKRARVGLSKKEKKAQKSAAKSTTRAPVLSPADIKRVADLLAAIEPSLPPSPADESPAPGARPRIKSSTPPPSSEETYSQPIAAMVADLGISAAGKNAVNAKAVAPLRVAIAGHLEVRRNEREEKAMRMGGFVRYVGKRTLEVLEANNLLVDPETGERIKGKKGKWGEGEGDGGDDAEEEGVEEEGEEVEEGEEEGVEEGAEAAFVGVRDERR